MNVLIIHKLKFNYFVYLSTLFIYAATDTMIHICTRIETH